jgi:hypothetical protein
MSDEAWQAFSQRVTYVDRLPLALEPCTGDQPAAEWLEERNVHVLNTLATLEERRIDAAEDGGAVMQELARLDSKLSVLMDIVGRLLMPDGNLPPREPLKLNALGAEIPAALVPVHAGACILRIHFDACRALPLMLPVRALHPCDPGRQFAVFGEQGQAVKDGLEKLVFRQHRRKVAEARHAAS